jgi:hypothetical protein
MDIDAATCSLAELVTDPSIGPLLEERPRERRRSTGPSVIPASGSRLEIAKEAS